jgi:hypothetical protein
MSVNIDCSGHIFLWCCVSLILSPLNSRAEQRELLAGELMLLNGAECLESKPHLMLDAHSVMLVCHTLCSLLVSAVFSHILMSLLY